MMKQKKIETFLRELAADVRWTQIFAMGCLMILSVIFVYSATYRGGPEIPADVKKQCIWFGLGVILYILASLLDYHWICRKWWVFYGLVVVSLVWVLKFGLVINNSKSWIKLGPFLLQPSEFAKLGVLISVCHFLNRSVGKLNDWRKLGFVVALAGFPILLIHKQPDFGTALVLDALLAFMIFLAGAPKRYFVILGILGVLVLGVARYETYRFIKYNHDLVAGKIKDNARFRPILPLQNHQRYRLIGFFDPDELNPLNEGWNRRQSLMAIGNGGLSGRGWNKGDITQGNYLPRTVAPSDFIFSVYAEEAGFLGGTLLVIFYSIIFFGGIRIALRAYDPLGTLLAGGIVFFLFFHVFVNMGMTLGILPIVGVPLPMMSYGGSFVIVCMTALGLLQSVWLHRKPY